MLDTAERLCDRVIILNKGQLVAQGTVVELKERLSSSADSSLEDMFLELTEDVTG
jgi:ABC-2 type transport system ATP-binding protein